MSATAQSRRDVLEVGPLEILPEEHLARGQLGELLDAVGVDDPALDEPGPQE